MRTLIATILLGMVAAAASVSQGVWKIRAHHAGVVDEYFVSQVDSLTLYDDTHLGILIPAGSFSMGSLPYEMGYEADEAPIHGVTLTRPFYVCYREVIQAEWMAVMGWNDSSHQGDLLPVEQVTWFDCIDYCNRRSALEGLESAYVMTGPTYSGHHITGASAVTCDWTKSGYRLLTEAEWEYICRAGTGAQFWTGDMQDQCTCCNYVQVLDPIGWYCWNSGSQPHQTMNKLGSPWGLYETNGNVWEWCWDWYGPYSMVTPPDPTGPGSGTQRVFRGGAYDSWARHCRSAKRNSLVPGGQQANVGLRVARTDQ